MSFRWMIRRDSVTLFSIHSLSKFLNETYILFSFMQVNKNCMGIHIFFARTVELMTHVPGSACPAFTLSIWSRQTPGNCSRHQNMS